LVVPKKSDASEKQKLRIVVDFRRLNDLTIGDSFPLPNITDILDQLGNAIYFSTLDLASGYHQIAMRERERETKAKQHSPHRMGITSSIECHSDRMPEERVGNFPTVDELRARRSTRYPMSRLLG